MSTTGTFQVFELEIGPHFITVYCGPLPDIGEFSSWLHGEFIQLRPELASIQQDGFAHEENDPKVYHPYGQPIEFRQNFRHFHVRYGGCVKPKDVIQLKDLMAKRLGRYVQDTVVTLLENNKSNDFDYPEPPQPFEPERYLKYIRDLKCR